MPKIPVILPEVSTPPVFQRKSGFRTVNLRIPGPWSRQFVPDNATMPEQFSKAHPNRLGAEAVPVRLYEPEFSASDLHQPLRDPVATIVWAHGGSFVRGDLESPDAHWFASQLAERGVRVITVDYSLVTDTLKAPAPANEMGAVLKWVEARYGGLILVGGASAGANLATQAALLQAADASAGVASQIHGLILLYPTLHKRQQERLDIAHVTADNPAEKKYSAEWLVDMYDNYLGHPDSVPVQTKPLSLDILLSHAEPVREVAGEDNAQTADSSGTAAGGSERASLEAITALIEQIKANDPILSGTDGPQYPYYSEHPVIVGELRTRHLARLPKTMIINAELDDLRASGEQFAEQLLDARVPLVCHMVKSVMHGFMTPEVDAQTTQKAMDTIEMIVDNLKNWVDTETA